MFLYKRNTWFILGILILFYYWATFKWNSVQQILTSCFSPVFSTRMNMRWLSFSFQHNINIETTLGHQHWINLTLSTMFCQHWNNVNKHTLAQLSFSTKFQRWNNVGSSTLNRCNSINVVSTLFCQRWNNVDKCTSAQLSFSTKYQRWNNVDERWRSTLFQRWFNVDVFAGMWWSIPCDGN